MTKSKGKVTSLKKVLASNLKMYRKLQGFSQAKLAEIVDVTENYIALIETGRRFPSANVLEKIAEALHIDSLELFSGNPVNSMQKNNLKKVILTDLEGILTIRLTEFKIE